MKRLRKTALLCPKLVHVRGQDKSKMSNRVENANQTKGPTTHSQPIIPAVIIAKKATEIHSRRHMDKVINALKLACFKIKKQKVTPGFCNRKPSTSEAGYPSSDMTMKRELPYSRILAGLGALVCGLNSQPWLPRVDADAIPTSPRG